jgi:hypothetical protein
MNRGSIERRLAALENAPDSQKKIRDNATRTPTTTRTETPGALTEPLTARIPQQARGNRPEPTEKCPRQWKQCEGNTPFSNGTDLRVLGP